MTTDARAERLTRALALFAGLITGSYIRDRVKADPLDAGLFVVYGLMAWWASGWKWWQS